jgi:hypothetical protein
MFVAQNDIGGFAQVGSPDAAFNNAVTFEVVAVWLCGLGAFSAHIG